MMKKTKRIFQFVISLIFCFTVTSIERALAQKKAKFTNLTISNGLDRPHLAIGLILDSATSLSRSYAFFELFSKNLLIVNGDTLYPMLTDYHFNTRYAIRGQSTDQEFRIILTKNGNKFKDIVTPNDWKKVYNEIVNAIQGKEGLSFDKEVPKIDEGGEEYINNMDIDNLMPGSMSLRVPMSTMTDTLRDYMNLNSQTYKRSKREKNYYYILKELYGNYKTSNENRLFFFRNSNVPYSLKSAIRPLIFPLNNTLIPCITYLSAGSLFENDKDYGASVNAYQSCLMTSNKLIAHPLEKSLVRSLAFSEMSRTHLLISENRQQTASLFKLAGALNAAYVNSEEAIDSRSEYYTKIREIVKICSEAERKAKEIRDAKNLSILMAVSSAATSISAINALDNTLSNTLMTQATDYLTMGFETASKIQEVLNDKFKNVDDMIDARSFITEESTKIDIGKSYLAGEVGYFLLFAPKLVEKQLFQYATDKPKLASCLKRFYNQNETKKKPNGSVKSQTEPLADILIHLSQLERTILNYEVRNIPIPEKVKSNF